MLPRVALPLRPHLNEQLRSVRCRTRTTPGAMKRHARAWPCRTPRSPAAVISVGHGGDLSIPPWHMDTHFRQGRREDPTSPPIRDTCRKNRLKQALPTLMRIQEMRNADSPPAGITPSSHCQTRQPRWSKACRCCACRCNAEGPDGRREQSRATDGLPTISQAVLTSLLRRFLIVAGPGQSNQTLWRNRVTH